MRTILIITLTTLLITACQPVTVIHRHGEFIQDTLRNGHPAPRMVVIHPGRFTMGTPNDEPLRFAAEGPLHTVTFRYAFAVSETEITWRDYLLFINANGMEKPDGMGWDFRRWDEDNTPVFNVSWHDAVAYTLWLSEQTGQRYRLLSEAEWEYGARAGTRTIFNTGNCINEKQANFDSHSPYQDCRVTETFVGRPFPVAQFPANAWGLYDVHGNIFEWVQDCWHDNYQGAPDDGSAWLESDSDSHSANDNCERRVLRGGSWIGRPQDLRAGYRASNDAGYKSLFIGFRIARDL